MSTKTKTNLTTYGERALTFFVTNNNKLKRVFHDTNNWEEVMELVNDTFTYTEEQYNHLKQKFDKATPKQS